MKVIILKDSSKTLFNDSPFSFNFNQLVLKEIFILLSKFIMDPSMFDGGINIHSTRRISPLQ